MKAFIVVAFGLVAALMVATYRPVQICEEVSADTQVSCDGNTCVMTTYGANRICHWRN